MNDDEKLLRELNLELIDAENRADRDWIARILAPSFAFQPSDESVVDGPGFLQALTPGGTRTSRIQEPVQLFDGRAIVESVVEKEGKSFHNLRLWVKMGGEWRLLAWANRRQ